ncbi:MAG: hypothetical protein SFV17_21225 [Candidatus Obscuribacter sp.]|nr:hypothetical protein [Candidatus Obscuribacter sp.]
MTATLKLPSVRSGFLFWTAAGFLGMLWLGARWFELLGRPGGDAILSLGAQCGVTAWLVLQYRTLAGRSGGRLLRRRRRDPGRCGCF